MVSVEHRGRFRFEDLDSMPDDGLRREIVGGSLVVSPAPLPVHQNVVIRLGALLLSAAPAGFRVLIAPVDWHQPDGDSFQPDLLVIAEEDYTPYEAPRPSVLPHLVVEVLSPSNATYDTLLKRERYEARGVFSYWIVEPRQPSVTELRLAGGRYTERSRAVTGQRIATDAPFPVSFEVDELGR